MIAAIFNSENEFYKFINKIELSTASLSEDVKSPLSSSSIPSTSSSSSSSTSSSSSSSSNSTTGQSFKTKLFNKYHNLLVLTIFTEKFKQFLNTTLHLELIKHYHNRNRHASDAPDNSFLFNLFDGESEVSSVHGIIKRKTTPASFPSSITTTSSSLSSAVDVGRDSLKNQMVNNTRRRHQKVGTTVKVTKIPTPTIQSPFDTNHSKLSLKNLTSGLGSSDEPKRKNSSEFINSIDSSLIECDLEQLLNLLNNQTMMQSSRQRIILSNNVVKHCEHFCANLYNYTLNTSSVSSVDSQSLRWQKNVKRLFVLCANIKNGSVMGNSADDDGNVEKMTLTKSQMVYSEFFILYDFISTILNVTNETMFTYDFIVLDFQSIFTQNNDTVYVWRPYLILQQHEFDRNSFIRHRMLPGHHGGIRPRRETFITCGPICWGVLAITIFILCFIIFASIIAGVSLR